MMENTQLQGQVPVDLFNLPDLKKVWVSAWSQLAPHSVSLSLRVKKIQTEQTCVTIWTQKSLHIILTEWQWWLKGVCSGMCEQGTKEQPFQWHLGYQ